MIKDLDDPNVIYYKGTSGFGKSIGMHLTSQFIKKLKQFQIFIDQLGKTLDHYGNGYKVDNVEKNFGKNFGIEQQGGFGTLLRNRFSG